MYPPPWKTVVIEDQLLFRDLLVRMLKEDDRFTYCGAAESAEEGFRLTQSSKPQLLLLDIQLPDGDGVEVGKRILAKNPDTRILAVTTLTDPDTINRILDAGIHGYIEKDLDLQLFQKAMVRVASGGHFKSEKALNTLDIFSRQKESYTKILSSREQDILRGVAAGKTSNEIGRQLKISKRTVESHRYNILKKLGLSGTAELVRYAIENGIIPAPPSP